MSTKIPSQVYLTFKKQPIFENYDNRDDLGRPIPTSYGPPLGFLHSYNPEKAHESKHKTQRDWAYTEHGLAYEDRGGRIWQTGTLYGFDSITCTQKTRTTSGWADLQPQILCNIPLEGFKVQHSVSRYSTANKLWRILDPRGFELEISTGCLEKIIEDATIIKGGLIDAPCVWAGNKNLVVVL